MLSAPSSPNMLIYAAMAVVGGLGVGVLLVVLLQLLERGLETSDAIEGTLGLATLASIPDARTLPGYRKSGLPAPPAELLIERRTEARRRGEEGVSTCRSRWSP